MNYKKLISLFVIILIFAYLFWNIFDQWNVVTSFNWNITSIKIVALIFLMLPIYVINVYSWHLITKAIGCDVSFIDNLRIWMLSNLSRFIPGGFWQYPGRVILFSKVGVSKTDAVVAVFLEALIGVFVGLCILGISFLLLPSKFGNNSLLPIGILFFFIFLALFFLSQNKFHTKFFQIIYNMTGKKIDVVLPKISLKYSIPLFCMFFLQYFFAGVVLFVITSLVKDISLTELPFFVGVYTLSWLIGYITFFAPGGLGVQDVSIAGLLSIIVPLPISSVIAILFRLLLYISEFVTLLFVFLQMRNKKSE